MSYLRVPFDPSVSGPQGVAPEAYVYPALRTNLRLGRVRRPRWPSMGSVTNPTCDYSSWLDYVNPICIGRGISQLPSLIAAAPQAAAQTVNDVFVNASTGKLSAGQQGDIIAGCIAESQRAGATYATAQRLCTSDVTAAVKQSGGTGDSQAQGIGIGTGVLLLAFASLLVFEAIG